MLTFTHLQEPWEKHREEFERGLDSALNDMWGKLPVKYYREDNWWRYLVLF